MIEGDFSQSEFKPNRLEISFELDTTILVSDRYLAGTFLLEPFRRISALAPARTIILDYPVGEERSHVVFRFENGLKDFNDAGVGRSLSSGEFSLQTWLKREFEDYSFEAAFFFNNIELDEPALHSFVNFENINRRGTHVDALLSGIALAFRRYVAKHDLGLKISEFTTERLVFSRAKLKRVLVAAIHVQLESPSFEGSARYKLVSRSVIDGIKHTVADALFENMESNPKQTENFLRHFRDVKFDFSSL